MPQQNDTIAPVQQQPLNDKHGDSVQDVKDKEVVDSEGQLHNAAPAPTEAIRKIWTKYPLVVAFGGRVNLVREIITIC
ncbi:unnamed protein product [Fusarium venenatum]|uniref:Uncharacterized protein n=1 Tax=Fusarium venenatum TaxID=56646 RepID=A0A2L2TKG9_9HYPO|nr:uncharacterized protein FVRRES_00118 [Fusarium venenatum]CEI63606.1 unnamed protein product [Fusarium venenatum]